METKRLAWTGPSEIVLSTRMSIEKLHAVVEALIGSAASRSGFASRITSYNVCYTKLLRSDLGGELTIFDEQCEVTATSVEDASQHTLSDGVWMNECHSMIAAATEGGSLQHPAEGSFGKTARFV